MKQYPSLEIVPPLKGITKEDLLNDIRPFIEFNPKYINVTCHRNEITYEEQPDGSYRKHIVRRRVSEKAIDEYARRRGMSDSEKARFLGHLL